MRALLQQFVRAGQGRELVKPNMVVNAVHHGLVLWRNRSFPRASFLFADGRFIILDEDGHLLLATATPEGLTVMSKVELLSSKSWTVPSLSDTRLYVRDRKNIIALELGPQ